MRFIGIDPSGQTGFVILDRDGKLLDGFEIAPKDKDKTKMIDEIVTEIEENLEYGDVIAIEGFSFNSKGKGVDFQYGLGHAIRLELYRSNKSWIEVTPSQVKKFATGNGNTSKENMIIPILRHWNFEHTSNNVRDAYVLAQIARATRLGSYLTKYQQDVTETLLGTSKSKQTTKAI
ncbi:crossover junction endodeoxyribonuclease RuvC [Paenibacillus apis]|uniref:Uncharacterized protein n=1 Tax=Paenibacillus apis TaxID=1792174 RepID=A0A919Y2F5_9BACL|nr:crossover junction endodeoxyribonuclease RuvC [Paenibacillus apis]GIO42509.1 hypothetical protein J41TS4_22670 [Paenibacillus apis]